MRKLDLDNVDEAREGFKLEPGGYICGIVEAIDNPNKEYLELHIDIADGPYKGYYRSGFERWGNWNGRIYKSYKEKALGFFKTFIRVVEACNSGYVFNFDENTLRNKWLGVVFGEEEYQANDGSIKVRVTPVDIRTLDQIRDGDYEIPAKKCLRQENGWGEPLPDDSGLPF